MGIRLSKPFIAADHRLLIIILLCGITFFVNLGKAPVYILDEAKNAQCAREMLEQSHWTFPTFNQKLRTDKPPLHYFFMAAAYSLFGINAFSARLFSAICGLFTVVLTYRFAAKHINKQVGFLSAIILLSSWQMGLEMRMAVPDPYLILLITLALYKAYDFYNSSYTKVSRLWVFYICVGLGILCKGPVALVLSLLILIIFLIAQKQFNTSIIKRFKPLLGLIIILAISLPWYYLVHQQTNGAWTEEFFFKHNIRRFAHPKEGHGGFFLLTTLFILVGLLPISVFIIQASKQAYRKAKTNYVVRFLLICVLVIAVFFTISRTRLPNYAMPCYPFLSILLANYLCHLISTNNRIRIQTFIVFLISLAVPTALYILAQKDITLKLVPNIWIPFVLLPIGVLIAFTCQFTQNRHRTKATIYLILLSFMLTGWILNLYAYPKVYEQNPVSKILKVSPVKEPLVSYKIYNPAFNFQLRQPVKRFEDTVSLMQYLKGHPGAQVVTRDNHLDELKGMPLTLYYQSKDIFETHTNCMLKYK